MCVCESDGNPYALVIVECIYINNYYVNYQQAGWLRLEAKELEECCCKT